MPNRVGRSWLARRISLRLSIPKYCDEFSGRFWLITNGQKRTKSQTGNPIGSGLREILEDFRSCHCLVKIKNVMAGLMKLWRHLPGGCRHAQFGTENMKWRGSHETAPLQPRRHRGVCNVSRPPDARTEFAAAHANTRRPGVVGRNRGWNRSSQAKLCNPA